MNLVTVIDEVYLTSMLPNTITIETAYDYVTIGLEINLSSIYEAKHFAYDGKVNVKDIRTIIETEMESQGLSYASIRMVYTGSIYLKYVDFEVVFCKYKVTQTSENFLMSSFLTTRKSVIMPRDGFFYMHAYHKEEWGGTNQLTIYYSRPDSPGEVYHYDMVIGTYNSDVNFHTEKVQLSAYSRIMSSLGLGSAKILALVFLYGDRSLAVYFRDEVPMEEFTFRNSFNIEEVAYIYGTSTIKNEVNYSEAIHGRDVSYYDKEVVVKHEVETAPMPFEEAKWFREFMTSTVVQRKVADLTWADVIISNITSEISDSDKDLIRMKFTWRYADGNEWIVRDSW